MKAAQGLEKFFLSSALHMEEFLVKEMKEVFPFFLEKNAQPITVDFPSYELNAGGVEFLSDLFVAHQFQLFTKTAHRLLWRVDEFKARDFPALFNKTKSSRLKNLISHISEINVKCSASESRLGQEKRIEESFLQALEKKSNPNSEVTVFIRLYQDLVQVSLDLSGEHLHFRKYAKEKGSAPLRETWASLFFSAMAEGISLNELKEISLLDPFVGSGTLLIESALLYQPNWHRDYALTKLPQAPKLLQSPDFAKNYKMKFPLLTKQILGIEKEENVFNSLLHNASSVKSAYPDFPICNFKNQDSLKTNRQNLGVAAEEKLWIFTNPPYGDRLNSDFNLRRKSGVEQLVANLKNTYKPEKIGLVLPFEGAAAMKKEATVFIEFSNGGLHCAFIVIS